MQKVLALSQYPAATRWPEGLTIKDRRELDGAQRELAAIQGVTVLVYDQTCAAEKRRRRKKGEMPDPDRRVIINELVCEGCGDCGVKSNACRSSRSKPSSAASG